MTEAKIALKIKKVKSEGKRLLLHSGELLHRLAFHIDKLLTTIENAYISGIWHAVIENTGAVYLLSLYAIVRECPPTNKGDLQFSAIDVCEVAWICIWPIACTKLTFFTNMHEILNLALDFEEEKPV